MRIRMSLRMQLLAQVVLALGLTATIGCSRSYPDAYGIYADTDRGQLSLHARRMQIAGNMMSMDYFAGMNAPEGPECSSAKDFIVYKRDIDLSSLRLVKMAFVTEGRLRATTVRVNLWVPDFNAIEFDVKPVEEHRDMYVVVAKKPLDRGFYGLCVGRCDGNMGAESNLYDLVIGRSSDFPSYAMAAKNRDAEVRENAAALLTKLNDILNHGDYQHLQDVYRPDGSILAGPDLQSFASGSQTWLTNAGQILKSDITAVSLIDDQDAHCVVKTTYQKMGVQEESITVRKIGNRYFVIAMK